MTLKYTFLPTGQQWAVVGPPEEMRLGLVQVQRTNGEMNTEQIVKLGRTFQTPLGPRQLGFLAALPRAPRTDTPRPQRFPVTTRKVEEQP